MLEVQGRKLQRSVAWLFIAAGLLTAAFILTHRVRIEKSYRQVEVAVDLAALSLPSEDNGPALLKALRQSSRAGAGAVVLNVLPSEGLDGDLLAQAEAAGLRVIPRFKLEHFTGGLLVDTVRNLPAHAQGILFQGGALSTASRTGGQLAQAVTDGNLLVYIEEDPRQPERVAVPGLADLLSAVDLAAARAYTVAPLPADDAQGAAALNRARLAVRERNVRLLIVHPFPAAEAGGEPFHFIQLLARELEALGMEANPPSPLPRQPIAPWQYVLLSLAVFAGMFLHVDQFRGASAKPSRRRGWIVLGAGTAVGVLAGLYAHSNPAVGIPALAFAAAVSFPALAVGILWRQWRGAFSHGPDGGKAWFHVLLLGGQGLVVLAGLSLAGGLIVAGLLSTPLYMLQAASFRGVKAAHVLPGLLVLLSALSAGWQKANALEPVGLAPAAANPGVARGEKFPVWAAVAFTMGALLFLFWIVQRTGNQPLFGVPQWERQLRHWLDLSLGVRPRFKEFLLGYPALGFALVMAYRRRLWLALAGLCISTIAGASIVNTFAHAHTPLSISLQRIGLGFLFGGVTTFVLAGLVAILLRQGTVGFGRIKRVR